MKSIQSGKNEVKKNNDSSEMKLNPTMSGKHAQILHSIREQLGVPTYPEVIRKILEEFEGNSIVILDEQRARQLESMLQFPHLKHETGCLSVEDLMNWILLRGISLLKKKIGTIYTPKVRARMTMPELKVADLLARTAYDPEWALGMTIDDIKKLTSLEDKVIREILIKLTEKGLITEHSELKGHYFVIM